MLTNGCFFPTNCWALTPYEIMGSNFLITQTLNSNLNDGYFVHQANGPGLSIFGGTATEPIYDSSADTNGVFARWTPSPVPEPSTLLLLGAGFGVVAATRRFKRRE
jgi:hypothetical protein